MKDLIERQAAIDALGEKPLAWQDNDDYDFGMQNQWDMDVAAIKALPSALPDYSFSESCDTCPAYDQGHHRCPRFNMVIAETVKEVSEKQLDKMRRENNGLSGLAEEITEFKSHVKSENSDYLTDYLCALSAVEGMIAKRKTRNE